RAALRIALADLGLPAGPVLVGERGGPRLPVGALGSVSHKRQLAVALAAVPDPDGRIGIGVDLEEDRPGRVDIARRVLTPAERAAADTLPEPDRTRHVLVNFAFKEAFYKAVDPWLKRSLSFQDVALDPPDRQGITRFSGELMAAEA